jgi:vacuolar-type H+-ATPase subunit C/Vma6
VKKDYTYMVARLRAIEAAMPDKAWFQRIARTPEDAALAALKEYYPAFEGLAILAEFERGLEAEKLGVLELISSLVPDHRVNEFFRAGYDFDNLVHMWKAFRLEVEPALVPFGLVDTELIVGAVRGEGRGDLPPYLGDLLKRLVAMGDASEPVDAELVGERAKWSYLRSIAPEEPAREYLRVKIDLMNIKNAVRLGRIGLRRTERGEVWLEGGEIEAQRWRDLATEPEEEILKYLEMTDYRNLIRLGLEPEMPLRRLEPLLRVLLFEHLDQSRYRFFDISPILFHLELHERNEQLVRAIVVGLMNGLPEDMILDKVDALYPS